VRPTPEHQAEANAADPGGGPVDRWRWRRTSRWGIGLVALAVLADKLSDDSHVPLNQDELTSLLVARSMRRHWGIPQLPSHLYYFKGELYHLTIAGIGALTHDSTTVLRSVSVLWLAATILAYGLVFFPTFVPGRPVLQLVSTALFATAPLELAEGQELRMYQMMQFFSVLFVAFLYRACTRGRTRDLVWTAVTLLLMYFSHEECFVIFLGVALGALAITPISWVRDRRWWYLLLGCGAVIGVQLLFARLHLPILGVDSSNKPYVGYDPSQPFYYLAKTYFLYANNEAGSVLACVGCSLVTRRAASCC
jgi:hypothetical protein